MGLGPTHSNESRVCEPCNEKRATRRKTKNLYVDFPRDLRRSPSADGRRVCAVTFGFSGLRRTVEMLRCDEDAPSTLQCGIRQPTDSYRCVPTEWKAIPLAHFKAPRASSETGVSAGSPGSALSLTGCGSFNAFLHSGLQSSAPEMGLRKGPHEEDFASELLTQDRSTRLVRFAHPHVIEPRGRSLPVQRPCQTKGRCGKLWNEAGMSVKTKAFSR
jgi:hypothetical protein